MKYKLEIIMCRARHWAEWMEESTEVERIGGTVSMRGSKS